MPTPHLDNEALHRAAEGHPQPEDLLHMQECLACRRDVAQTRSLIEALGSMAIADDSRSWPDQPWLQSQPDGGFSPVEQADEHDDAPPGGMEVPVLQPVQLAEQSRPVSASGRMAVEVVQLWGHAILDVRYCDPGRALRVGGLSSSDFTVPESDLALPELALVVHDGFDYRMQVLPGMACRRLAPQAGGVSLPGVEPDNILRPVRIPLHPGDRYEIVAGGSTFLVGYVAVPNAPRASPARLDYSFTTWLSTSTMAHAALLIIVIMLAPFLRDPVKDVLIPGPGSSGPGGAVSVAPLDNAGGGSLSPSTSWTNPRDAAGSRPAGNGKSGLSRAPSFQFPANGAAPPGASGRGKGVLAMENLPGERGRELEVAISALQPAAAASSSATPGSGAPVGPPPALVPVTLAPPDPPTGDGPGSLTAMEQRVSPLEDPSPAIHPSLIEAVVARWRGQVRACYEKSLLRDPQLAGRVLMVFTIGPDGAVTSAQADPDSVQNGELHECLESRLMEWRFPVSANGSPVTVRYGFRFRRNN
ncbi:MAG: hypothetical protein GMKNLPBB_01653 [Myxococcota bacterium]|nr:hypothetical protein [Myxococcota bacterium]